MMNNHTSANSSAATNASRRSSLTKPSLGMSQSLLAVTSGNAGSKRPRTITAQADALVMQQNATSTPSSQVVVGISASADDDVEDWSSDFVENAPRASTTERTSNVSGRSSEGEPLSRMLRNFPRGMRPSTSSQPTQRRSWHRQRSIDNGSLNDSELGSIRSTRSSRIRKSTNELSGVEMSEHDEEAVGDDDGHNLDEHELEGDIKTRIDGDGVGPEQADEEEGEDGDDDDDEDWDVEFGFADAPDDEHQRTDSKNSGLGGVVDADRRRSDNFNIFLRGFHDMMAGDDLLDDEEDLGRPSRPKGPSEEQLFQRRRSDFQTLPSMDGNADVLRSSLTSLSGATEYMLVDKYRLLDAACSSTYAVRIERYPKPCTTYSNLEKESSQFPLFTDNRLEQWLANVARGKCDYIAQLMAEDQANTPNPRQQKNHQFRTLVSLPFGRQFVDMCFKQICVYRYHAEEKSNKELIRVFFEKMSTAGITNETRATITDLNHITDVIMEVLQEAARLYGPIPTQTANPSMSNSSSGSNSNSATSFWMRQFESILPLCLEMFPNHHHMLALIELRFVCHHVVGFAMGDLRYTWQVCNRYPPFAATQMIAGQAAPIIANEILQNYGALISALQRQLQAAATSSDALPTSKISSYSLSNDSHCLLALALCDVQSLYESKSALAEIHIPELIELFEFEEELEQDHHEYAASSDDDEVNRERYVLALLRLPSSFRRRELEETLYKQITVSDHPLIKAKCATVLSSMHASVGPEGNSISSLRVAESLGFEALRLLERVTTSQLSELTRGDVRKADRFLPSLFANDGLLSELGREVLESLGNVLVKNQKYRYGILCLEAAGQVYALMNQGRNHDRLYRLMCTLATQADDVARALVLHEKVAASALRQGNANEYVFLSQALVSLWIREGKFSRAEEHLSSAFHFLRDQTSLLPPFFLSSLAGSYSSSEATTPSSRSGTILTTSSTASSSLSGSFVFQGRGNTTEIDQWLNHDLSLHLLLRDIYRASGRFVEGMRVLEYLLNYSVRLPRGKRTQLRMLLAEDALQLRVLDTTRYMLHLLDQEANFFCDRLLQTTVGGIGSSGGGFSSGSGSNNSGSRGVGGMGSEARFCFDMVLSIRSILCRTKLYLHLGELHHAYAWLSLAHTKNEPESVRTKAKLHMLDGHILMDLLHRQHEQRLKPDRGTTQQSRQRISVDEILQSFSSSLYALSSAERNQLRQRMEAFSEAVESPEKTLELGVQAYWTAFDQYQALDDGLHQLKALLGVIQSHLAPVERAFFALGSSSNDDLLLSTMGTCIVNRRSSLSAGQGIAVDSARESDADGEDDAVDKVRKTLLDVQRLLRRALSLSEQIAEPACYFRTLVYCAQTWTWLERLAPYKTAKQIKEGAAFWEEAVKVLNAVFLRRVAFESGPHSHKPSQHAAVSSGLHGDARASQSTFSMVPILNFRESFIVRLESSTLQLVVTACQLQQFEGVPDYVEEMLMAHIDELLSARMCLNSISHQLRSFRSQQQHAIVRSIPLHYVPGPSSQAVAKAPHITSSNSADGLVSRSSFSSNPVPGVLPTAGSAGSIQVNASGTKRKGHKKNQSMSSISELLASSANPTTSSTSFHDLSMSSSFISASGSRGTMLSGTATPRTGLASLSDRSALTLARSQLAPGVASTESSVASIGGRSPAASDTYDSHGTRVRSRSAPYPVTPGGSPAQTQPVDNRHHEEPSVRVVDLKDVRVLGTGYADRRRGFGTINEGADDDRQFGFDVASSSGGVGIYDFDDVQSEKLWWIFNTWHESKASYINGKTEISAFRHQNLRTLRLLLDAFDPQQVAVLYAGGSSGGKPGAGTMQGYDVAHIHAHALVEDHGYVLSVGYNSMMSRPGSMTLAGHGRRLEFKVFPVVAHKTVMWRTEIPPADWYLNRYDLLTTERERSVLRTLQLLGAKTLLKIIGVLLLENSLVVVGSSFPQVKEVVLCLLKLLHPFKWRHTFLPFLPVGSWQFLHSTLQLYTQSQVNGRSKTNKMLPDWRWGSPRSTAGRSQTTGNDPEGEPPFIIGVTAETWHLCRQKLRSTSTDDRSLSSLVNVLDLDDVAGFATAKNATNAVSFPRKWRKHFMERFEKVVKQRRKAQDKMSRRGLVRQASTSSTHSAFSMHSPATDYTSRSYHDGGSVGSHTSRYHHSHASHGKGQEVEDRGSYDMECSSGFVGELQEFYDRLCTASAERAKKRQLGKKKHSKRQEIKSWFSSSHDFDAFVDKFIETAIFSRYEYEKVNGIVPTTVPSWSDPGSTGRPPPRSTGTTSARSAVFSIPPSASSSTSNLNHPASLARSFGSMSSTSSFGGMTGSGSGHQQL